MNLSKKIDRLCMQIESSNKIFEPLEQKETQEEMEVAFATMDLKRIKERYGVEVVQKMFKEVM